MEPGPAAIVLGVYLPIGLAPLSLLAGRLAGRRGSEAVGLASAALVAAAALLILRLPRGVFRAPPLFAVPGLLDPVYGVDMLSRVFAAVVALVGGLVVVYSLGYMAGDEGYARYYALLSLFLGSMMGLVLTRNLGLLYLYWEAVGLCSFSLIGHYYVSPRASRAGVKAFIVTRLGDAALLAGLGVVYSSVHGLGFQALGSLPSDAGRLFTVLAAVAVVAKSAQLPLHVWLPDAMEGPTPVSALIHAATMVKAGAYLVLRLASLHVPGSAPVLEAVAAVAAVSAVYAAVAAAAQVDAKRLLAYSTMSHLGYIIAAAGLGAAGAALGHVVSHAVFKSLLFLAVGVAVHELEPLYGPEVARRLDTLAGLGRRCPVIGIGVAAGAASLAGLPPFGGFWSKEALLEALHGGPLGFLVAAAGAVSVLYAARLAYYVLAARPRVEQPPVHAPPVMAAPVLILSVLTLMPPWLLVHGVHAAAGPLGLAALLAGLGLAAAYLAGLRAPSAAAKAALEGFYLDKAYERLVAPAARFVAVVSARGVFELVESSEEAAASAAYSVGRAAGGLHKGRLTEFYAAYAAGLVVLLAAVLVAATLLGW